ncbi:MAG: HDIG domain-containing protein [Proteobacteria bacterium]|nr:HDIG domain-containing protein [Pseudomonadota bacterium]MBU1546225.1 HDIG domain-containing protein [Pseudomonadota bacterium]MBU2619311.1 HDIG domain-containing protein [Pseudomonadota bacterium]
MDYRIAQKDIETLRTAGMTEADLNHSLKVANKALEIARRTGATLDLELVGRGALFHDLGKTVTHEISHGRIGAELGAKLGLPQAVTVIMEKHIRGGLTEPEAVELGLPVKDYTLNRLEERIIIYADRLVDIIHDGIVEIKEEAEAEARFVEILNEYPKYGKNEITLRRYLGYHEEIQGLINGRIIDAPRLKGMLAKDAITLLDVRRKADRETAPDMIPGAVWRDPEQVQQWAGEIAKDTQTVIYCARGGSVSQSVTNTLREKGLAVAYLDGGLKAWTKHGETLNSSVR